MKKLLIAEDEKNLRILYKEVFEKEGYEVKTVKNGLEAVEAARDFKPDCVIMDIRMPEMDGLKAMNKILSEFKHIPVVINSAYHSYKDDFKAWSADAFVVKSSDLTELKETVKNLVK